MIGRTAEGFVAVEPMKSPRELAWEALQELGKRLAADQAKASGQNALVPVERVAKHIIVLRGEKVMLDADLAELYGVETKALNRAVLRNIDRFPPDFMFQLTEKEADSALRYQIGTSNAGRGGRRYLPYVFTEQGIAMLSSVLRSDRAVQVNIAIMRAFVGLRNLIGSHAALAKKIADLEAKFDGNFTMVFQAINDLIRGRKADDEERPPIGFLTEAGIKHGTKNAKRMKHAKR